MSSAHLFWFQEAAAKAQAEQATKDKEAGSTKDTNEKSDKPSDEKVVDAEFKEKSKA